ncbi:hypothetical protein EDD11_006514 [Mortierella claussenii]|nr:hypothetical protein EDD11_006514 [Mortierella claussenii]
MARLRPRQNSPFPGYGAQMKSRCLEESITSTTVIMKVAAEIISNSEIAQVKGEEQEEVEEEMEEEKAIGPRQNVGDVVPSVQAVTMRKQQEREEKPTWRLQDEGVQGELQAQTISSYTNRDSQEMNKNVGISKGSTANVACGGERHEYDQQLHDCTLSKSKRQVMIIRKRSLSVSTATSAVPPSLMLLSLSSSSMAVSVRQVKRELKMWALTSLFVLRTPESVIPRSIWDSGDERHHWKKWYEKGWKQVPNLDRYHDEHDHATQNDEYGHGEESDESKGSSGYGNINRFTDKRRILQRGSSVPSWSPTRELVLKRSPASGSAMSRLARMALDPERLGSILQFYRRKHTATISYPDSKRSQVSTELIAQQTYQLQGQGTRSSQDDEDLAFVIRSSHLSTVRVGLYGTAQKRLWTSTGSFELGHMDESD